MRHVHRSGRDVMLRWLGIGIAAVGVGAFGLLPAVIFSLTRSPQAVAMLIGLPVALVVGAGMFLVGTRRRVEITPEAVTWYTVAGPARTVPFGQVRHVEVPLGRSGEGAVVLHLLDGSAQPVSPLRMSLSDASNYADAGYRTSADALRRAHASWWERARGR